MYAGNSVTAGHHWVYSSGLLQLHCIECVCVVSLDVADL